MADDQWHRRQMLGLLGAVALSGCSMVPNPYYEPNSEETPTDRSTPEETVDDDPWSSDVNTAAPNPRGTDAERAGEEEPTPAPETDTFWTEDASTPTAARGVDVSIEAMQPSVAQLDGLVLSVRYTFVGNVEAFTQPEMHLIGPSGRVLDTATLRKQEIATELSMTRDGGGAAEGGDYTVRVTYDGETIAERSETFEASDAGITNFGLEADCYSTTDSCSLTGLTVSVTNTGGLPAVITDVGVEIGAKRNTFPVLGPPVVESGEEMAIEPAVVMQFGAGRETATVSIYNESTKLAERSVTRTFEAE